MKVSIKQTLIVYCYKADNYDEFKRRVCLLIRYIQKQIDTRLTQFMIKDFQNKEIILSCEEVKIININAKELAEYVHTLDNIEYKHSLNTHYGMLIPTFKTFVNFEKLNFRR